MRAPRLASACALCLALAACGGDDAATDADTSTATTTGGEASTSTASASTSTSTASDAATETAGETEAGSSTGYAPPSAEDYCACMLEACHDLYHATWGENHVLSEMACLASAAESPSAGMPATEGDFIECRAHYCALAAETADMGVCDSALGEGACQ
ncbi:MAG: hypothetical protein R3A79_22825 [Nannocystaceae bacterium]